MRDFVVFVSMLKEWKADGKPSFSNKVMRISNHFTSRNGPSGNRQHAAQRHADWCAGTAAHTAHWIVSLDSVCRMRGARGSRESLAISRPDRI